MSVVFRNLLGMHGTRDIVLVSVEILFFWMSLYFYVPFLPIRALELGASNTLVGVVRSVKICRYLIAKK